MIQPVLNFFSVHVASWDVAPSVGTNPLSMSLSIIRLPHVTGHYCGHFLSVPICVFIVFELHEGHTVADMIRSPLNLALYVCVTVLLPFFLNDWKPGQIHVRSELKRWLKTKHGGEVECIHPRSQLLRASVAAVLLLWMSSVPLSLSSWNSFGALYIDSCQICTLLVAEAMH